MVRDKDSAEPLYPLTVARETVESDAEVAKGEKLLSHAVIHAASAEVPVSPMTRIDHNIANGIKRAVNENRISNVIIGWNGQTSARQRVFGSILDQILTDLDEMVMVCKIEQPVNTFKRIVVAIPPFSALEVGFAGAIRPLKLMAQQLGADFVITATEERLPVVQTRVNIVKPEIDVEYSAMDQWGNLPAWMGENLRDNDLFILISAHEGSISWRPGLDRLPRVIAQKYPKLSFMTIYPSEVEVENSMIQGAFPKDQGFLSADRIQIGLSQKPVNELIDEIVSVDSENDKKRILQLREQLLENSESYTPEVMPGVLLYEARTGKMDQQKLYIGVSKEGLNVKGTANPVKVILILVSPKSVDKQEHLTQLNAVVKMIKSGGSFEKVIEAEDAQAAASAMMSR